MANIRKGRVEERERVGTVMIRSTPPVELHYVAVTQSEGEQTVTSDRWLICK